MTKLIPYWIHRQPQKRHGCKDSFSLGPFVKKEKKKQTNERDKERAVGSEFDKVGQAKGE